MLKELMETLAPEQIAEFKRCGSVQEIMELAEREGLAVTPEQAEAAFAFIIPQQGELSDAELAEVTGGKSKCLGPTIYECGCPLCGGKACMTTEEDIVPIGGRAMKFLKCGNCGRWVDVKKIVIP